MGTLLFVVLHFFGYTSRPDEWYTVCYLLSLDMISVAIVFVGTRRGCGTRDGGQHE